MRRRARARRHSDRGFWNGERAVAVQPKQSGSTYHANGLSVRSGTAYAVIRRPPEIGQRERNCHCNWRQHAGEEQSEFCVWAQAFCRCGATNTGIVSPVSRPRWRQASLTPNDVALSERRHSGNTAGVRLRSIPRGRRVGANGSGPKEHGWCRPEADVSSSGDRVPDETAGRPGKAESPWRVVSSPGSRTTSYHRLEHSRQVALIDETTLDRDVGDSSRPIAQQLAGEPDATLLKPAIWRRSGGLTESP